MCIRYRDLFLKLLLINSVTFGGGYTIVPVIKEEFSVKNRFLSEKELLDIIAIAQSTPGALAINTSFLVGYSLKGFPGAVVAVFAAALPCVVIISLISYIYTSIVDSQLLRDILQSMSGAITAILFVTVFRMFRANIKNNIAFGSWMFASAFALQFIFQIKIFYILCYCAVSGILWKFVGTKIS